MDLQRIPKHVAIIMDGNGRWAKKRGLPRTAGHLQGAENVRIIAKEANRLGIKTLVLYAFSTENWNRPEQEIDYLCKLPKMFFGKYIKELKALNIRVTCIGEFHKFPKDTVAVIESAMNETAMNTGLNLCLAVNYGARKEITLAAQQYARDVLANQASLDIDEEAFGQYMMGDHQELDLLIRTSGEVRLSNFLLWQCAYAEMIFTQVAWPDFDEKQLHHCIEEYQQRDRRFGGLKE